MMCSLRFLTQRIFLFLLLLLSLVWLIIRSYALLVFLIVFFHFLSFLRLYFIPAASWFFPAFSGIRFIRSRDFTCICSVVRLRVRCIHRLRALVWSLIVYFGTPVSNLYC